jgi:hypothetical protein
MGKFITMDLIDQLAEAGVIADDPRYVRRVIIDLQAGTPARIYIEKFGDNETLTAELVASLGLTPQEADDRGIVMKDHSTGAEYVEDAP